MKNNQTKKALENVSKILADSIAEGQILDMSTLINAIHTAMARLAGIIDMLEGEKETLNPHQIVNCGFCTTPLIVGHTPIYADVDVKGDFCSPKCLDIFSKKENIFKEENE